MDLLAYFGEESTKLAGFDGQVNLMEFSFLSEVPVHWKNATFQHTESNLLFHVVKTLSLISTEK